MNALFYLALPGLVQLPDKVLIYQSMAVLTAKLVKANLKPVELPKAFAMSLPLDMNWGKWIRDLKIQIVPIGSTGTLLACPSNVRLLTTSLYKIL